MVEKGKLVTLLSYLIEHNGEHSQELRELAGEVSPAADGTIPGDIKEAARLMDKSTEYLKQALVKINRG